MINTETEFTYCYMGRVHELRFFIEKVDLQRAPSRLPRASSPYRKELRQLLFKAPSTICPSEYSSVGY